MKNTRGLVQECNYVILLILYYPLIPLEWRLGCLVWKVPSYCG
jgi:hypothetical protein